MRILIDADSCPKPVRALVLRTSQKKKIPAIFAANRIIPELKQFLKQDQGGAEKDSGAVMEVCSVSEGSADNRIVELARQGDLVVTRDVPLAERLVDAGVNVLDDRGRIFTRENIRYYRSLRDFTVDLATTGEGMERTANFGKKDLKNFADSFDRELTRLLKNKSYAVTPNREPLDCREQAGPL